ncbi:MAG TPA: hypothetical protein VJZ71_17050 [Phycisphaerae bacterium]|nr:hypothetical protein [Phycisphaerae bacterium]
MSSVYIETTIPSYYFETRKDARSVAWREATREWWDRERRRYRIVTSAYVLAELALSPPEKAAKGRILIANVPWLNAPPGAREVAQYYIDHQLMPKDAEGDAMHLALASIHGIDFLLTWNCQHLANMNKIRHLSVLNARLELPVPVITTPLTLMTERK